MADEHVIRDEPGGWRVLWTPETGSTNDDLLAAADAGSARHLTALRTDHQTTGRGRLDRRWSAPPGANLLVSLLFTEVPERPALLTQLVGVAVVDAVERLGDGPVTELGLKWPNDVLVGDRKLAGILAQRSPVTGAVVVGVGLNVRWAPDGAASLADDLGLDVDPVDVLDAVLAGLGPHRLTEVACDPDAALDRYRTRLSTMGAAVRVELPADRVLVGTAVDVDRDGRLVVDDEHGRRHVLDVGDVVHLRPG